MTLYNKRIQTTIGSLLLEATDQGLRRISISNNVGEDFSNKILEDLTVLLVRYFEGEQVDFKPIPLDVEDGYSDFMKGIWSLVQGIPYGQTRSYMDLAKAWGNPKTIRAVGMANGKNPVPIVIPCHRVIGSDGSLTGYALGVENKALLLQMECPTHFGKVQTLF